MKFLTILVFSLFVFTDSVNSHCPKCCNTPNYGSLSGPLQVFYEGEKCECGRVIPVHIETVKPRPEARLASYSYDIQTLPEPPAPSCGSSYNFYKEVVKPQPMEKLRSYEYDVYSPPEVKENPILYSYDYQIERLRPEVEPKPEILYGHIDRVLYPNKDCVVKKAPKQSCGACGRCPCRCAEENSRKLDKYLLNDPNLIIFRYDTCNSDIFRLRSERRKRSLTGQNNLQDDDTLLQKSFFDKNSHNKTNSAEKCNHYTYKTCGTRPNCNACYNCTCIPVDASIYYDENDPLLAATHNTAIPDQYDPIMRQEVSIEPLQYTQQSKEDYARILDILQINANPELSDEDVAAPFPAPAPSQQAKDVLKLLIDLMENKDDVKAYEKSNTFQNPHDWMHLVHTDSNANKIIEHSYLDTLPLDQLHDQKLKYIDEKPRPLFTLPERTPPKPLYSALDRASEMYKKFKTVNPQIINDAIAPLNKFLSFKIPHETNAKNFFETFRPKRSIPDFEQKNFSEKLQDLYNEYERLLELIKRNKHYNTQENRLSNSKSRVKATRETKEESNTSENHLNMKYLEQNPSILLGEEPESSENSSEHVETVQQDEEFVT